MNNADNWFSIVLRNRTVCLFVHFAKDLRFLKFQFQFRESVSQSISPSFTVFDKIWTLRIYVCCAVTPNDYSCCYSDFGRYKKDLAVHQKRAFQSLIRKAAVTEQNLRFDHFFQENRLILSGKQSRSRFVLVAKCGQIILSSHRRIIH